MSHSDYRTLVHRGRKSGLTTLELYRALAGRPPLVSDFRNGAGDVNGFVPGLDEQGNAVYRPQSPPSAES
jgi:hypothetical protein